MYYNVEEMGGYYRIGSPEGVFCYVVAGQEKAMLIDTGYAYGDLKAAVRAITDKPLYIVNTHGHLDHTCGNNQFEEAAYIHKKDMELCRNHTNAVTRKNSMERARHSMNYETGFPFQSFLSGEENPRVCALDGMTPDDMFKPGFAALVLSKGK